MNAVVLYWGIKWLLPISFSFFFSFIKSSWLIFSSYDSDKRNNSYYYRKIDTSLFFLNIFIDEKKTSSQFAQWNNLQSYQRQLRKWLLRVTLIIIINNGIKWKEWVIEFLILLVFLRKQFYREGTSGSLQTRARSKGLLIEFWVDFISFFLSCQHICWELNCTILYK